MASGKCDSAKTIDFLLIQDFSLRDMKGMFSASISIIVFFSGMLVLVVSEHAQAQEITYVSNLGENPEDYTGYGVGSNQWLANSFVTGTTSAGYQLNSVQIPIGVNGNPSGFSLSLYSDNSGQPGSNLGTLGESNPTDWALYNFTISGIELTPSTTYWIVATSPTPAYSDNSFYWVLTSDTDYTSSDGWSMNPGVWRASFSGGSSWSDGTGSPFQFAVSATPVPEPEIYSLAGLGLWAIFLRRRK
jgi:hypothetical protein